MCDAVRNRFEHVSILADQMPCYTSLVKTHLDHQDSRMMASNIFFVVPICIALVQGQWVFLAIASSIMICSPLFHWYNIVAPGSWKYWLFRVLDWVCAGSAVIYLYLHIGAQFTEQTQIIFQLLLSLALLFFWYGWRYGNYRTLHPWFHLIVAALSSAILLV